MPLQPTILYAEDSESDRLLLQLGFERINFPYSLQFVEDGVEVIEYLSGEGRFADRATYPNPCLLLSDLKMPRMNGFELLEWIRSQPAWRHLPVIILTGSDEAQDRVRALKLGANEYMVKDLFGQPGKPLFEAILRLTATGVGQAKKAEGKRTRRNGQIVR